MLEIGRHLVESGHQVRMMTGSPFAARIEAAGLVFVPLPAAADIDETRIDELYPELQGLTGVKAAGPASAGCSSIPSRPRMRP